MEGKVKNSNRTRFDIDCMNFDLFAAEQVKGFSTQVKAALPADIRFHLYGVDGKLKESKLAKISFIAKLWMLVRFLRKRVWIVVEDENGLDHEAFLKLQEAVKAKEKVADVIEEFTTPMTFVTANRELGDTFDFLNKISVSPNYTYMMGGRHRIPNGTEAWKGQMVGVVKFLITYESNKKKWVAEGLSVSEWYCLLSYYDGTEANGTHVYRGRFRSAFQSSIVKVKMALSTLQTKGFLVKSGSLKYATYRITPAGTEIVNRILDKYAFNG